MPLNSFESRIHQGLQAKIHEVIATMTEHLINGVPRNAMRADATAQAYSESIGYIRALKDCLILCQDVEDDLLGRKKTK